MRLHDECRQKTLLTCSLTVQRITRRRCGSFASKRAIYDPTFPNHINFRPLFEDERPELGKGMIALFRQRSVVSWFLSGRISVVILAKFDPMIFSVHS